MGTAAMQGDWWGARAADWSQVQEPLFQPIYRATLAAAGVNPQTRLLDVGCGAGLFARLAGDLGARVSGLDASAPMIAIAKSRAGHIDWRIGDMEELPFPDESFDVVTGFNAFQYAGDPGGALREARRVCRPGGTVCVAVWGRPEDCEAGAHLKAIGRLLPPAPAGAPGPFALSADDALKALASRAGLAPRSISDVDAPWEYPDLDTALRGLLSAGPAVRAIRHSGEDAVRQAVAASIEPFRTACGAFRLRNTFRLLLAVPERLDADPARPRHEESS